MPEEGREEQEVKVITCIQYDQTLQPLNHANMECMKKSSQKPGDWDLKPGDVSNKTKRQIIFVMVFFTLLVVFCFTLLLLFWQC